MTTPVPFVNRKRELDELRQSAESGGEFITVGGPSGSGKSALLDQFQERCEDDGVHTVRHDIGEPKSDSAFLYRFLETWDQSLPDSRWESIKQRVHETNTDSLAQAASLADPALGVGARVVSAVVSGAVDSEALDEVADEADFLVSMLQEGPDEKVVVIIDQFDERRLKEPVVDELARLFREVSRRQPENIVWCIGTDHEFAEQEQTIDHLEVGPLNSDAIEELIDKSQVHVGDVGTDGGRDKADVASFVTEVTNFDGPDLTKEGLIEEISTKTKGHPFMLVLFLQMVRDEDLSRAIQNLPMRRPEVRDHLELRLLDRMKSAEEELMRDLCVLSQFDPELAARVSGNSVSETRQMLSDLNRQSILRELQGAPNEHMYRSHDLIRDFLRNEVNPVRKRQSRYRAVAVLAQRVSQKAVSENPEAEIVNTEVESYCDQIQLQFEQVLEDVQVEDAIEKAYSVCDNLNYTREENVGEGLKICYSVRESQSLDEVIPNTE